MNQTIGQPANNCSLFYRLVVRNLNCEVSLVCFNDGEISILVHQKSHLHHSLNKMFFRKKIKNVNLKYFLTQSLLL